MKQRLTSKVNLTVDIQENFPDVDIMPLIFIPFIENAFKHGISYREGSFISISLHYRDDKIFFSCKNSIPKTNNMNENDISENKKGGMGIVNIKKRLDLLYGKSVDLHYYTENNFYIVELIVPKK